MGRTNQRCPCCDSEMKKTGFDDDWMVLECVKCTAKVEKPFQGSISNSGGYTMENLQNAGESADKI